ncbi:hypothetical protein Tco_0411264 [Tanacetum coccineum]
MRAVYNIWRRGNVKSFSGGEDVLLEAKVRRLRFEITVVKGPRRSPRSNSNPVLRFLVLAAYRDSSLGARLLSAHDGKRRSEQVCTSLQLRVAGLESIIAGKDQELSDLGASSSSLRSENQSLLDQVHKLEIILRGLRLKWRNMRGSWHRWWKFQTILWDLSGLGMAHLQPDADQLMVPIHHKRDRVIIGSQALSVALNVCRGRVEKIERNLIERLPFLKDVFASIKDPLSVEALD